MWLSLLFLWACDSTPDVYKREATAIREAQRGERSFAAGDLESALAAFDSALEQYPDDAVLLGWRAKVLAAQNRYDAAERSASAAARRRPDIPELALNQATYLIRLGQIDAAGEVLDQIRAEVDWEKVAEDSDFKPFVGDPRFPRLPTGAPVVRVSGPPGSVFVGSQVDVRVVIEGAPIPLRLTGGSGPVVLTELIEDRVSSGVTVLIYRYRVTGGGSVSLGPWQAGATTVPQITFDALAPEGATTADGGGPFILQPPSAVIWDDGQPGARETKDGKRSQLLPGDPLPPRSMTTVRLELREEGNTRVIQMWEPRSEDRD